MIVRFDNRRSRDLIYSARIELRNSHPVPTPIYINEHLTKKSDELFLECRKMWKSRNISSAWTFNGNVFIKPPEIEGGATVKVNCLEDLNSV